ncbi:palmitoyl-protein thioesterase 1-like [Arvicanthis niloticus]|uniref:palmitoyl-protein thioesterase 1-like n=1 Tax=Arvicanthis niloticus TaxID=61156 RepID=UPI00402B1045
MMLPQALWLLSVCLLSCCYGARLMVFVDPRSESTPLPAVIWSDTEDTMEIFKTFIMGYIPGIYVLSLEIEKSMKEDLENQVLDASFQLCQILNQDPKLQNSYIAVAYSKGRQFL